MEAEITLFYESPKLAKAISDAVSPDNIRATKNLSIKTYSKSSRVVTFIEYSGDNIMTFLSTIDDLLSCVSGAEKTFRAIKKTQPALG